LFTEGAFMEISDAKLEEFIKDLGEIKQVVDNFRCSLADMNLEFRVLASCTDHILGELAIITKQAEKSPSSPPPERP